MFVLYNELNNIDIDIITNSSDLIIKDKLSEIYPNDKEETGIPIIIEGNDNETSY